MEIKINVDETQFKEILENNLKALPGKKLQEIIMEGIREYLKREDVIKNFVFKKSHYYSETEPSDYMMKILDKNLDSEVCHELQEEIINWMRDNYHSFMRNIFADMIIKQMFERSSFRESASHLIREEMYRARN